MKPFEGIRVLDLTHVLAGPFSTYQLGVLGAEVIKIESPTAPDMTRFETVIPGLDQAAYGTYFQTQNAGKKAVTVDLATPQGKDILRRLIATADVLVQNYAGDALEKLGFGYSACSTINPKLIYCTISGYGRTGPKANHPAYDIVIQAFSGLMAANGSKELGPTRVGPPMVDYGTGAQAALAISAALFQRNQTGKGQFIDVSMLDSALMLMSAFVVDTVATQSPPVPPGNIHPRYAGYRTYQTADDLLMVGAWTNKQLANLFTALGEPDLAETALKTERSKLPDDIEAHTKIIADHLLHKTADAWEEILNSHHVPAARVRTLLEALNHPQVTGRRVLQQPPTIKDQSADRLPVSGFAYRHGSPSIESPPPKLGEHTEQVLSELGYAPQAIEALRQDGVI